MTLLLGVPGAGSREKNMCRSIKTLRRPYAEGTDQEGREAALQYVRKISGFRKPSQVNERAFDAAIEDVARASRKLLDSMTVRTAAG